MWRDEACWALSPASFPSKVDEAGISEGGPGPGSSLSSRYNLRRWLPGVQGREAAREGGAPVTQHEHGLVDTLRNKTDVDLVGYGVQYQLQVPGKDLPQPPPYYRWDGLRQRLYAPSEMVSGNFVNSAEFMRLSMNPGGGTGGTCFGDSGGPDLLGGTDTVLAVNSYVTNINCSGVGYSSRVDIPEVLDWINSFP